MSHTWKLSSVASWPTVTVGLSVALSSAMAAAVCTVRLTVMVCGLLLADASVTVMWPV